MKRLPPKFNGIIPLTDDFYVHAVMVGYENLLISVAVSNAALTINYTFIDYFDAEASYTKPDFAPAVPQMYTLQHYYSVRGKSFVPFIWRVTVQTSISR